MNVEDVHNFCLTFKGATESFPFDDVSLVCKVMGKMFVLIPLDKPTQISVKCDPDLAIELRETYDGVSPAFHFNKKYWNTIALDKHIPENLIKEWIKRSYDEVVKKLTNKQREELSKL